MATELLVTVDAGDVELFETTPATAQDMMRAGARRIGRPARGGTPPSASSRHSLAESGTRTDLADLAVADNPYLASLCGSGSAPSERKVDQFDDSATLDRLVDRLSDRVAERLDARQKQEPTDSKVDELLPADAPGWFREMFRSAA